MADDIRLALATAGKAGADSGKHGENAMARAKLAIKKAGEASRLVAITSVPDTKRLVAMAAAAADAMLADVVSALAVTSAGADLIAKAEPLASGGTPEAENVLRDASARFDDAAALLANADAGCAATGDLLNLLLSNPAVSSNDAAKASVQAILDAVVDTRRFTRSGVSSAVQAREAIGDSVRILGEPLPPVPEELSKLNVRAVSPSVAEGDPGAPDRAVAFIVSREGPVGQACSVAWARTGSVIPADFVTGTEVAGRISWASGDDAAKRIEFFLAPDSTVEPDETVVVELSVPEGADLGTEASATTTVSNDDTAEPPPPPPPPPVKGYDQDLPYGGLGIGTACLLGQPGNQQVYSQSSMMILCERSGNIDRISWQNRINGHGRTGYSTGDGGTIHWTCRVVADPKAETVQPGPVLGQTRQIKGAATAAGWKEEYQEAGGKGAVPTVFVEIPTLRFLKPFKVRRGDMLLLTQHQTGKGTVSINNNYSTCRSLNDWSPYAYHASARQFQAASLSTRRKEHYPLILVGYADGVVKGTGVMGYSAGLTQAQESIELGGNTRARQVIPVPEWADGKAIKRVVSFWGRTTAAVNGSLRCRIRLAQGDGGGDEGQALADSVILADKVAYRADIKNGSPAPLLRHNFDRPAVLRAGQVIYVVMEVVGGSTRYRGSRCVRWLSYPPVGLKQADWALKGMEGQRDTGAGWKSLAVSGVVQDLPLWCEFG